MQITTNNEYDINVSKTTARKVELTIDHKTIFTRTDKMTTEGFDFHVNILCDTAKEMNKIFEAKGLPITAQVNLKKITTEIIQLAL